MTASLEQVAKAVQELDRRKRENRLAYYQPYPGQLSFHNAGKEHRERLQSSANRVGKTFSASMEIAMHATGEYPSWWDGKRFSTPTRIWVASTSGRTVRDTAQFHLFGLINEPGTGAIPKAAIIDHSRARGLPDALDNITVRHKSGGTSIVTFKSYEEGSEKFESDSLHVIWLDEPCGMQIYSACLARIATTRGIVMMTATPLCGMDEVMRRFFVDKSPDRFLVRMELDEAAHIPPEERQKIIDSYPEHERDARTRGIPMLGSGRIYAIAESEIKEKAFRVPDHWPRIIGLDIGNWTAAVEVAWDRDSDTVHVIHVYKKQGELPIYHAAAIKKLGPFPIAWPNDAAASKDNNTPIVELYKKEGCKMLPERAQFPDGSVSVEAGIIDISQRMRSGRFKVFDHLEEWFEEFRTYHRKDGKIVKEHDHALDATRYAVMTLAKARTREQGNDHSRRLLMERHREMQRRSIY